MGYLFWLKHVFSSLNRSSPHVGARVVYTCPSYHGLSWDTDETLRCYLSVLLLELSKERCGWQGNTTRLALSQTRGSRRSSESLTMSVYAYEDFTISP